MHWRWSPPRKYLPQAVHPFPGFASICQGAFFLECNEMAAQALRQRALAAEFVMGTLGERDDARARALVAADPGFATLVEAFRQWNAAYDAASIPHEYIWPGIETRLTGWRR
jgi:anti-sigma-K factor RskA